jgi:hypothetical protein
VVKTRQGWLESKEVVEVWYDPKVISYEALLGFADDNECARQVWTRTEKQLAIAQEKASDRAKLFQGAIRLDKEQKYYLLQTPLKELALSEAQASRVNASMDGNWKQYLSPTQRKQAQELLKPKKDED